MVNRKKNFEIQKKMCKVWDVRCEEGGILSEEWAVRCDAREMWIEKWGVRCEKGDQRSDERGGRNDESVARREVW